MGCLHHFVAAVISVLVVFLTTRVSSSGVFELRLRSFRNDLGRDVEGNCCRGLRLSNNGACSATCVTKFQVCLKHYQANIDPNPPCTYGGLITPVLANNSVVLGDDASKTISGFINPMQFPFGFTWPGDFVLIVDALHEAPANGSMPAGKALVMRMAIQRTLYAGDNWKNDTYKVSTSHGGQQVLEYGYRVRCDPHYYGDNCNKHCKPRDDVFGHYTCSSEGDLVCLPGWTGTYCEKAMCLPGCHKEHGHCSEPNECKCRTGWQGRLCDECIRYPGCLHGTCQEPWQCKCNEGWGGLFCNQDLNYCTNHKPCRNGATCLNTGQGSYTCTCPPGFTGTNCEIVLDDCTHHPCLNGGKCTGSTGANVTCECPPGFHGRRCETSAQTCQDAPCLHGATCLDTPEGYMCLCPAGFDGINCGHQVDDCAINRCQNGGSCIDELYGFKCICPAGFTGELCQTDINDCSNNPCLNQGTCVDMVNSFRCVCVPGFVGSLCQTNVDDCLTKPCANGGLCHDLVNDYNCTCKPGFTGKDCSVEINECAPNPCRNGGTCLDRVNEFECRCAPGYAGQMCERFSPDLLQQSPMLAVLSSKSPDQAENAPLTTEQVVLIATFSTAVPILALVSCVVIMVMKRRRRRAQSKADEEARRQNEQNAVHQISDKMDSYGKEHRIVNALDYPKSKCVNAHPHGDNVDPEYMAKEHVYTTLPQRTKMLSAASSNKNYINHPTSSFKSVNTNSTVQCHRGSVISAADKLDKEYDSLHRSAPLDNRLMDSSIYCNPSDPSLLKRPSDCRLDEDVLATAV